MDYYERRLDGTLKYSGVIVKVRVDEVELSNGSRTVREVVEHPGGVGIVPVDEAGNVYMVRQYRYPAGRALLEIPAGKLEYGEDPFECAKRELGEETGLTAARYVDLGMIWASPGFSAERLYLYLALDLTAGEQHPDSDELLNVECLPLSRLVAMAEDNELQDGKTIIGVLKARDWLNRRGS